MHTDRYKTLTLGKQKIILEFGCGPTRKFHDSITIDKIKLHGVDITADINKGLSFIPSNSVDEIHSYHFLEHIENLEEFLQEIHRVLKPGGKKIGTVPHFSNPYFYSDYTHSSFFGLYSFSYFSKNQTLRRKVPSYYNSIDFDVEMVKLIFASPFFERHYFKKIWQFFFNSTTYMKEFYEENLTYIIPAYEIYFVLKKPC